ncbi:chloride channel protein 2c [Danio rerio]|uniref:Chloride channel 2c n=1 Tax=Danio rerio TaxID=7955 RepID=E7FCE2_DANRE|nr:chloride channel protein 2c [Danio rerio]CEF79904.1 clc-2c chloride channel [Danio rerio]|eukprot:NP_001306200.1 chloride channel 2c [Danio rerio]
MENKGTDENDLERGIYTKSADRLGKGHCHRKSELNQSNNCGVWIVHFHRLFVSLIGADWIFLMILGFILGTISFLMDIFVDLFTDAHRWIYYSVADYHVVVQYLVWVSYSMILMCFAAGFANIVSPQAVGSGIPEMKTALRGVVMQEYLTFRTLVSKVVSLTCVLGSELPVGKEGPFVHIGSLCASLLCKFMALFSNIYKNEARNKELLTVGCAVGIGCCFASPIGGALFSIEVTAMYYLPRNYWRAFLSATFGAIIFRLLPVWHREEETLMALYATKYRLDFPFDLQELPVFVAMGIVCGLGGAFFVFLYGKITLFVKEKKASNSLLMRNCFYYSALTSVLISTLTFPPGFGQFMAGKLTQRYSLISFFDDRTWSNHSIVKDFDDNDHLAAWKHPYANVFVVLFVFVIMKFWMSALSITLPIPCGSFVPIFVIGAGFGRLIGEGMATLFPEGFNTDGHIYPIVPGAYAVVGAAALTAGVTHTMSTAVIMMELTGHLSYSLPILISVILSNMVSQSLQPSIYDTVIRIKRLPYLPLLRWGQRENSKIHVEDFMNRDVRFITLNSTYRDVFKILCSGNLKTVPMVKSTESMLLLGSIERAQLLALLIERTQYLRGGAYSIPARSKVHFQTATEDSSSASAQVSPSTPLKSALKRPTADEEQLNNNVYDSGLSFKTFFCSRPDTDAMKNDPDAHDDMILQEIEKWEEQQLDEQVNFNSCQIDPAPFQLVDRTTLHKTHSMFSVLNLDYAFVTSVGRLVGVVSLNELCKAITGCMPPDGVSLSPILSGFRERGSAGWRPEVCELHKLLDHQDC